MNAFQYIQVYFFNLFQQQRAFIEILSNDSQSISHRGINLDNVLIDNFDKIVIIGFGTSSNSNNEFTINPKADFTCFNNSESILKHPTLGTFDDTWALGVFLYYIITGKPPYTGLNPYDLVTSMNGGNVLKPSNMSVPCYNLLLKLLDRNNQSHYSISLAQNHFWFSNNGKSGLYSKSLMGYQKFKIQKDNMYNNRHIVTTNYSQKKVCDRSIFQNCRGSNIQQQDFSNPYHMSFNRVAQQTFG